MDNRCFKTERTHCNILKATFSNQEEKGTFSRRLQPKRGQVETEETESGNGKLERKAETETGNARQYYLYIAHCCGINYTV